MENKRALLRKYTRELVRESISNKFAINIKTREDFIIFLEIVNQDMPDIDPVRADVWDLYKERTCVVVDSRKIMFYSPTEFYSKFMLIVEYDIEKFKAKKEEPISAEKMKELVSVLIKSEGTGQPRALIVENPLRFEILSRIVPIKGRWASYTENTCIHAVNGELVVTSYDELKASKDTVLFAKFDPTQMGYVSFDGLEDTTIKHIMGNLLGEDEEEVVEEDTERAGAEDTIGKPIEETLNKILKDIGTKLLSDEVTLDEKMARVFAFGETIKLMSGMFD